MTSQQYRELAGKIWRLEANHDNRHGLLAVTLHDGSITTSAEWLEELLRRWGIRSIEDWQRYRVESALARGA